MSVWLTPERKPFFGGTYFPPDNRFGRPGFEHVLESLAQAWRDDRARVEESGEQVVEQLREYSSLGAGVGPQAGAASKEVMERAFMPSAACSMRGWAGSADAPKFPRPSIHNFLLRYYASSGNEEALEMVLVTLRDMAKGGMNDQFGGGFHRYSVDEHWFVPHFEKMLYDQAQLATSYLEAFQITRDGQYAAAARDIFGYVLRDMADSGGGFYSAEDADSAADPAQPHEKGEGAFYIWRKSEIDAALEPSIAAMFCYRFGVGENGNVDEDPQGEFRGSNILFQSRSIDETAAHFGTSPERVRQDLSRAGAQLLEIRSRRPRPLATTRSFRHGTG